MATTTALITISSEDLLSDELALTSTSTLTQAANSTGLSQTSGLGRKKLASGHATYTLFDGDDYTADKAHKIYLKNTSTTASEYFEIIVNSEQIGRLYAGDWAFFPWMANASTNDIKIDPSAADMVLEYMLFIDE
tara:strand:- start:571 stop:975 length:405 start_codon:yes stop_codon:yes gene_type:complete